VDAVTTVDTPTSVSVSWWFEKGRINVVAGVWDVKGAVSRSFFDCKARSCITAGRPVLLRHHVILSQGKEGVGRLRRNRHDRGRGPVPARRVARKNRLAGDWSD
jgi:hypothetical protein